MYLLAVDSGPSASWLDYVQSGGIIGMFLVLTWFLLTRRLVMGWTYDAMVEERDYYRTLAHRGTEIADRQMTIAESLYAKIGVLETRHQEAPERRGP